MDPSSPSARSTILIGVDESEPTLAAIRFVTGHFTGTPRPQVSLVHVLALPAVTVMDYSGGGPAFAGAMMPGVPSEMFGSNDLQAAARASLARMDPLVTELQRAGWSESQVLRRVLAGGVTKAAIADAHVEQAQRDRADVVVVGRTRHGALHDTLMRSTGEKLVHFGRNMTICVVTAP